MKRLRDLEGADIIFAHDPDVFKAHKHAPQYYKQRLPTVGNPGRTCGFGGCRTRTFGAMQTGPPVVADRLSKGYGPRQTIADISFSVAAGEVVGLVGANGSGKFLTFMAEVKGLHGHAAKAGVGSVMKRLRLGDVAKLAIAELSHGYRQRVAVAQALLGSLAIPP